MSNTTTENAVLQVLNEVSRLQAQLQKLGGKTPVDRQRADVERYLDSLTEYAESIRDDVLLDREIDDDDDDDSEIISAFGRSEAISHDTSHHR